MASTGAANPTAVAIGGNAQALGLGSVALGEGALVTALAPNSVALGAGSVADRPNTVSVGTAIAPRQITNVAPATFGTDAVNLDQLTGAIDAVRRQAFAGIAASIALSSPATPTRVGRTAVTAGVGHYGGQTAAGLTFNSLLAGGGDGTTLSVNGGIATGFGSDGQVGARIGIGIEF